MECPICGEIAEKIYYSQDDEIVGCDCCVTEKDADEIEEEYEDERNDRKVRERIEARYGL